MNRFLKIGAIVVIVIGAICFLIRFSYHKAITYYPEFYRQRIDIADEKLEQNAKDFVFSSGRMLNDIRRKKEWSATYTEDQINGWLERRIQQDLPGLIPIGSYYPRVHLEQDRINFAMEFCPEDFESIFWAQVRFTVPEPGVYHLIIEQVKLGVIPISRGIIKNELKKYFDSANIPCEIQTTDKGEIELVMDWRDIDSVNDWKTDPLIYHSRKVTLTDVKILPGELKLAGTAKKIVVEED